MRRWLLLVLGVATLAVGVTAAQSAVRQISITSPVRAGETASLSVGVSPAARCTIAPAAGTYVRGPGLSPKSGRRLTWRWKLRLDARPGRSQVVVRCGDSGTLRATFRITRAVPEIGLAAARRAVCERAPARVERRYKTQLVPLLDRTLAALRAEYGAFDCAYGSNYYKDGGPISYYLLSVRAGTARCTFAVTARVVWADQQPLPGYTGPVDESYVETCTTLRAPG
jgi:hypothetical protein